MTLPDGEENDAAVQELVRVRMMNIGFVSTRFCGTDGVTLETSKWAQVFTRCGHGTFWFAGELDRDASVSYLAPEAHFLDSTNCAINDAVMGKRKRTAAATAQIHEQRNRIKTDLYRFLDQYAIDLLVAQNCLALPMQIPLGLALTELIAETGIPTIGHHHDFSWERDRYAVHAGADYLQMAFPPRLPTMEHVVINTLARESLARRTGLNSTVVPNVLDFGTMPDIDWDAVRSFRDYAGLTSEDTVILQPTRIIQRKGIEHAINFVRALNRPTCKLVISHKAGDEGYDYANWIADYARSQDVQLVLVECDIDDPWGSQPRQYPRFSLSDVYPIADFVTFPSLCEGFGNALLEAIYFRKPLLVNRYPAFVRDIEPLGFQFAVIDGFLTDHAVAQANQWLTTPALRQRATDHNWRVAARHFSYTQLHQAINRVLVNLNLDPLPPLPSASSQPVVSIAARGNATDPSPAEQDWAKSYN